MNKQPLLMRTAAMLVPACLLATAAFTLPETAQAQTLGDKYKVLAPGGKPLVAKVKVIRDPAAQRIEFRIVSRTDRFKGRVRITGVVKNIGLLAYKSSPNQQSILLYEDGRLVARRAFQNLTPGQEVSVSFERHWNSSSPAEGEFPPTYRLVISYDPDITLDDNPHNDDGNWSNNQMERRGSGINALFR